MIPAESDPRQTCSPSSSSTIRPKEQDRQADLIRSGRSVMDVVGADAKALQREVRRGDREKLDAWFTSVRELEQRLQANEEWVRRPKPKVACGAPQRHRSRQQRSRSSARCSTSSTSRCRPTRRASSPCTCPGKPRSASSRASTRATTASATTASMRRSSSSSRSSSRR